MTIIDIERPPSLDELAVKETGAVVMTTNMAATQRSFPRPRIRERSIETHVHLARAHASAKEVLYATRTFHNARDEADALRDIDSRISADYLVIMHRLLFGETVRVATTSGPAHFGMVIRIDSPAERSGALFRLRLICAIERPAAEPEVVEEWANVHITSNITIVYPARSAE